MRGYQIVMAELDRVILERAVARDTALFSINGGDSETYRDYAAQEEIMRVLCAKLSDR